MCRIQQVYGTHCTYGTSAIRRGKGGSLEKEPLGYSARASSLEPNEVREHYESLQGFWYYRLPPGTPPSKSAQLTARTAPRRFFYFPQVSGRRVLGQLCYRQRSTDGRLESYFGHILTAAVDNSRTDADEDKNWDLLRCLALWDAPGWQLEDEPRFSDSQDEYRVRSLSNLGDLLRDKHQPDLDNASSDSRLDKRKLAFDRELAAFLDLECGVQPSPSSASCNASTPSQTAEPIAGVWRARLPDVERRRQLVQTALAGFLENAARTTGKVLLVAEPELAVLLFYAVARLLPDKVRNRTSFSTYEHEPGGVNATLVATMFEDAGQKVDCGRYPNSFVINTFQAESGVSSQPRDSAYLKQIWDLLEQGGLAAVDQRLKCLRHVSRAGDLEVCATVGEDEVALIARPPSDFRYEDWRTPDPVRTYVRRRIIQELPLDTLSPELRKFCRDEAASHLQAVLELTAADPRCAPGVGYLVQQLRGLSDELSGQLTLWFLRLPREGAIAEHQTVAFRQMVESRTSAELLQWFREADVPADIKKLAPPAIFHKLDYQDGMDFLEHDGVPDECKRDALPAVIGKIVPVGQRSDLDPILDFLRDRRLPRKHRLRALECLADARRVLTNTLLLPFFRAQGVHDDDKRSLPASVYDRIPAGDAYEFLADPVVPRECKRLALGPLKRVIPIQDLKRTLELRAEDVPDDAKKEIFDRLKPEIPPDQFLDLLKDDKIPPVCRRQMVPEFAARLELKSLEGFLRLPQELVDQATKNSVLDHLRDQFPADRIITFLQDETIPEECRQDAASRFADQLRLRDLIPFLRLPEKVVDQPAKNLAFDRLQDRIRESEFLKVFNELETGDTPEPCQKSLKHAAARFADRWPADKVQAFLALPWADQQTKNRVFDRLQDTIANTQYMSFLDDGRLSSETRNYAAEVFVQRLRTEDVHAFLRLPDEVANAAIKTGLLDRLQNEIPPESFVAIIRDERLTVPLRRHAATLWAEVLDFKHVMAFFRLKVPDEVVDQALRNRVFDRHKQGIHPTSYMAFLTNPSLPVDTRSYAARHFRHRLEEKDLEAFLCLPFVDRFAKEEAFGRHKRSLAPERFIALLLHTNVNWETQADAHPFFADLLRPEDLKAFVQLEFVDRAHKERAFGRLYTSDHLPPEHYLRLLKNESLSVDLRKEAAVRFAPRLRPEDRTGFLTLDFLEADLRCGVLGPDEPLPPKDYLPLLKNTSLSLDFRKRLAARFAPHLRPQDRLTFLTLNLVDADVRRKVLERHLRDVSDAQIVAFLGTKDIPLAERRAALEGFAQRDLTSDSGFDFVGFLELDKTVVSVAEKAACLVRHVKDHGHLPKECNEDLICQELRSTPGWPADLLRHVVREADKQDALDELVNRIVYRPEPGSPALPSFCCAMLKATGQKHADHLKKIARAFRGEQLQQLLSRLDDSELRATLPNLRRSLEKHLPELLDYLARTDEASKFWDRIRVLRVCQDFFPEPPPVATPAATVSTRSSAPDTTPTRLTAWLRVADVFGEVRTIAAQDATQGAGGTVKQLAGKFVDRFDAQHRIIAENVLLAMPDRSNPTVRRGRDLVAFGMGKIHTLRALARGLECPDDFLPEDEIVKKRFRKYFRKGRWPSRPALNLRRLLWPAVAGAGLLFALAMIWLLIRGPAPQAKPDTVTTDEDQPLTVSWDELLKNDENVGRKAGQITISVPERTDDGNITISNDAIKREIVLKPTQDFPGKSSFEYELRDKWGRPSPARVTIQVRPVNDPPQAPPVEQATVEDTPLTISSLELRQQAKDVDDDLGQITLVSVGKATHGTVKGPDSVGTVEFIPDANFHGDDASFEYTIRDRAGAKATGTVNIKVAPVNDPPTPLQPVLEIKWDKQPPIRIPIKDLVNNFKDVDNITDQLTFDGLVEKEYSGGTATRDSNDVQFTPEEKNQDRWFCYRVKDPEGKTGEATVKITITKHPSKAPDAPGPDASETKASGTETAPVTPASERPKPGPSSPAAAPVESAAPPATPPTTPPSPDAKPSPAPTAEMTKPAETLPPRSPAETARPPAQTASEGAASDFWPFESQDVYVTLCEPSQFKSYNRPQVPLTDKFDTSAYTIRRIYGLNELTAALRRGYKNEGLNLVEISAAAAATDGAAAGHNAPPRRDRVKIELQDDTAKMSQTIIEFGFTDQLVGYPTAPPASADAKSPVFVQLEEQLKSCVVELQETSTRRSSYVFLTKPNLKAGKLESRYPVAAGEKAKPKDGSADSQEPDYGIWEIDLASYGLVDVKSQAFVRLVGLAGENEARWEPDSLIPVQASDQAKWAFSKLAKGAAADTKLKLQSAEVTLKIEGTKLAFTLDILLDVPTAQADALAPLLPVEIRDRRKELQELRRDTSGSILMDKTAREKSEPMLKQLGRLIGVPALDLPDKARGEGTGSPLGGSVLDQKPPQNSRVTREEYRSRAIEIRNTTDKALAELSRIERSASILGVELYRVVEVEQGRKVGSPIVGIPLTKVPREFHRKSPRPALRAPSLPTASALPATSASRLPQAPATLPGAGGKP